MERSLITSILPVGVPSCNLPDRQQEDTPMFVDMIFRMADIYKKGIKKIKVAREEKTCARKIAVC